MAADKGFAFAFVEGALVKAVREGWWLLLDEINLAPAEVRSQPAMYQDDCVLCSKKHTSCNGSIGCEEAYAVKDNA